MDRTSLPSAAVTLTAAAGVLHGMAALAHADVSLLLTAAFVVVAAVQVGTVASARRWPAATAEVLVFVNLAAVGAWAVSRTIGLPLVGTGVEPVGIAGLATVVLQLVAVATVVLGPRLRAVVPQLASFALVASLGAVAVAAPAVGHAHDDDHGHADEPAGQEPATTSVIQLGPGDFEGDTDLSRSDNAARMKALMTGAAQPVIITSDGTLLGAGAHGHDTGLADAVAARRAELTAEDQDDDGHPHAPGTAPHQD